MISLEFKVVGKPATQGSKRAFYNAKIGRALVVEDCKRNKPWRADVRAACEQAMERDGWTAPMVPQGPVKLILNFVLARPRGHFGSGKNAGKIKATAKAYPTGKPDVVKLARAVEDALKGVLWTDDSQVVMEKITKRFALQAEAEGVTVTVEVL